MDKVSTRKIFFVCFLLTTAFGVGNLFLNKTKISTETNFNLSQLCFATVPISLISIGVIVLELSLILYFLFAALNGFVHIRSIIRLTVRSLIWYPVMNIINGLGIAIFHLDISSMGYYKIIYYIPFSLLVGVSIFRNIKSVVKMPNAKRAILSIVGTAATSLLVI